MENFSIFIFDDNDNSKQLISSYIKEEFPNVDIKIYNNIEAEFIVEQATNSSIIILNIDNLDNNVRTIEKIKKYTSKIIATTQDYSTDTIVKFLRNGIQEILSKPILKKDLINAINDLQKNNKVSETHNSSKVISIYSNKGGIGKTTISINLAEELAKYTKEKVALLDFNFQLGDITTFLNINPTFSINYVIQKMLNKDEGTLLSGFTKYKDTPLYILANSDSNIQNKNLSIQEITKLITELKKVFSYIIIDMPSNLDALTLHILDISNWILFTSIANLPAIRNIQRCLNLFRTRDYADDKVKIIINRFMENDEIKIQDIEDTIKKNIYWKIPNNYFTIMEAINKGISISEINPNSNINNSFRDFAIQVSDDTIREEIL